MNRKLSHPLVELAEACNRVNESFCARCTEPAQGFLIDATELVYLCEPCLVLVMAGKAKYKE